MSPVPPCNEHQRTPRTRHLLRRTGASLVAGLVAIALAPLAPMGSSAAGAGPVTPGGGRPSATVHRVTLLTGDTVTVTELAGDRWTVAVAPDDRVGAGAIRTTTIDDHVYVVPAAAMPFVASGAFDRALFDVTGLVEQGFTDEQRGSVPLIVQYDDSVAPRLQRAPDGSDRTRSLTSISAAAVDADKSETSQFWRDVTGRSPAVAPRAARATLRDDIAKVWLDGLAEATLADSVAQVGAPQAWEAGFTGSGVRVAVLDSGADLGHPDLAGQVADSRSFVPGEDVTDVHGHGTHVASTVAGTGAASDGLEKGVAPDADLLIGKVLGNDGFGQDSWIIDGMEWAANNADVVNMSLGSLEPTDGTDPLAQALNSLTASTGTLFVVAAGNLGMAQGITSPAAADAALTVGAVDGTDALAWFSSQGPRQGDLALKPDLVAPGVDILAARSQYAAGEGPYETMSGTSMAAPHVAGAAAILAQRHPGWGAARLKDVLMSTSVPLEGMTGFQVGSGRLDVPASVLGDVSATGSVFFGFDRWPHGDELLEERTVTYHNEADEPVELDLGLDVRDAGGTPAPEGMITASATSVTVPAHGTAAVELTLDPLVGEVGKQYTGRLSAAAAGEALAHTTLGFVKEDERYDLTISVVDAEGQPASAYVEVVGGPAQYDVIPVEGTVTRRLPAATYSLSTWFDLDADTDHAGIALLAEPEVVLDRDQSVTLDAREVEPVTVAVPESQVEATHQRMSWYRKIGDLPIEANLMAPVWNDAFYATPTAPVEQGEFEFNTRWRLRQPLLAIRVGHERLDVIAQAGAPLFEGTRTLPVRVVGEGAPADYEGLNVRGKVAVAVRSDAVSAYDRAVAAREAGARLLLVVNDAPTELSEWVGGPEGQGPGIPVGAISGTQGAQFLDGSPPARVRVSGHPDSAWVYDLQAPHPGAIPADLAYRPSLGQLAKVTSEYASDREAPGAEFRYDFRPYTFAGVGFMESLSLPQVRDEWVSNAPGTTWYQEAMVLDQLWDVRGVRAALVPGSRSTSRWFSPVVRPRIGAGYWKPSRSGAFMSINLPSFADSGPGHTGDMYGVAQQHIDLYTADGTLLRSADDQAMWPEVPEASAARFRLVSTATRDPARWRTSTSTRTEWWFWSREPAEGYTDLPLLSLDYEVQTDLAGRVGPGPTRLRLTPVQVDGADMAGRVAGARLWASYDGGHRWRSVQLNRSAKGSWTAVVPQRTSSDGRVSLKATAWDTRGNSVSQVVIGAYRLP